MRRVSSTPSRVVQSGMARKKYLGTILELYSLETVTLLAITSKNDFSHIYNISTAGSQIGMTPRVRKLAKRDKGINDVGDNMGLSSLWWQAECS